VRGARERAGAELARASGRLCRRGERAGGAGRSAVEAGGDVEGRRQSRAREWLRRELTRPDAGA
jgi:hypothetical protein